MNEGAIAELVSRGKKDAYFNQNARRTWFGSSYTRRSANTSTYLTVLPTTPCMFNARVDIELPRGADILQTAEIRIQMPTWLPPEVVALNRNTDEPIYIQSPNPVLPAVYGWVNGFPNFLIQKWELYADNMVVTQGYGTYSSWEPYMNTTTNQAPILNITAGQTAGTDVDIRDWATPPELTFRVPLPGCQYDGDVGLPLFALQSHQKLFLRLWIAPKELLVESGPIGFDRVYGAPIFDTCPAPWDGKQIYTSRAPEGFIPLPYKTLSSAAMGLPTIYGRFNVLYVDNEARDAIAKIPYTIPYKAQYVDQLVFDKNTWIPGNQVNKLLNIRGYFQSLFLQFISSERLLQNKYRDCNPPGGGTWVTSMSFNVNAEPRISQWNTQQLEQVAQKIRLRRDIPDNLFLLLFGTDIDHEPAGNLFLGKTHKALIQFVVGDFELRPTNLDSAVTVFMYGQGWGIIDIKDGRMTNRYTT